MDSKKIAFISCINDHEQYDEAQYYISQLVIPEGYSIETIAIENAPSMTAGYNKGMKASEAKYKVYLHQDTLIINKNFIQDIIKLFAQNASIGMMGVVGCRNIPANGIWWEDPYKVGKVYDSHTGSMALLRFSEIIGDYEPVQGIDGLIMITQYDIPWREDIFNGWHFYDLSQSREFALKGYQVVVPNQETPWVIHDCDIVNISNQFDVYQKKFLDTYGKELFSIPKVVQRKNPQLTILDEETLRARSFDLFANQGIDEVRILRLMRRIENHLDIEQNLSVLSNLLELTAIKDEWLFSIINNGVAKKEEVYNLIAAVLYQKKDPLRGIKYLEQAFLLNPHNNNTVYNMALILYEVGEREAALQFIEGVKQPDDELLMLKLQIQEVN